jgi:hypothetical protein
MPEALRELLVGAQRDAVLQILLEVIAWLICRWPDWMLPQSRPEIFRKACPPASDNCFVTLVALYSDSGGGNSSVRTAQYILILCIAGCGEMTAEAIGVAA